MLVAQPRVVYSTYFGGSGAEVVTASTTDDQGRVWVTGYTLSNDLPISNAPYLQVRPGQRDIFVAQIDTTRTGPDSLLYASYIGGTGSEEPTCITVAGGFVYIAGTTNSSDFPLGGNAFQPNRREESQDAFVLKLDPTKGGTDAMAYSTYLGGSGLDRVNAITARAGFVYLAGYTTSGNFPRTANESGNASTGNGDAFVTVIDTNAPNAAASLNYSTLLSGIAFDSATAIGLNAQGDIFVAGTTASGDFTATSNGYQAAFQGGTDVFLVRLNGVNRARAYSTFLGGSAHDVPLTLSVTGSDVVMVGGYSLSNNFPTTEGAPRRDAAGSGDAFVARFNVDNAPAGQLTFSTLVGGNGGDVATGISPGPNGSVYVTGYTLSDDFPVIGAALQEKHSGAIDAFIARLDPAGRSLSYSTLFGGASVDSAHGIHAIGNCEVALAGQTQSRTLKISESAYQNALNGLSDAFVVKANLCAAGQQ